MDRLRQPNTNPARFQGIGQMRPEFIGRASHDWILGECARKRQERNEERQQTALRAKTLPSGKLLTQGIRLV